MEKTINKQAAKMADLMIKKIETLQENWQKPWFSVFNKLYFPQNYSGRRYSSGNAFMLFMLCDKLEYKVPKFVTFKQAKDLNLSINKGEQSFPVFYTDFVIYERETKAKTKMKLEEYNKLSIEEQKKYSLVPFTKWYLVFNLQQTNFANVHAEEWEELKIKYAPKLYTTDDNSYKNEFLDDIINLQKWVCQINLKEGDRAFYSVCNDNIVLPLKKQFKKGERFYGTALHEMAHSTGIKERLNRKDYNYYGREELVAEFTSALMCFFLGIEKEIQPENAAYLKSWLEAIQEEPKYLISVLNDCTRAVKFMQKKLNVNFETEPEATEQEAQEITA